MKKLDVEIFIVDRFLDKKFTQKVIDSFKGEVVNITVVDSLFEINSLDKVEDWYGVFYQDEIISDELLVALESFFDLTKADVLVAFKKELNRITKCPRFFRNYIELDMTCLSPEDKDVKHEIILNGYILEND